MNAAQRIKFILENFIEAKKSGPASGYDIAFLEPDNYEAFLILIQPKAGVYKGHSYVLELKTTYGRDSDITQYPINPPYAHFVTDVFHVNISSNGGSICVDILKQKEQWSPTYSFDLIVQNMLMLFDQPNNASPYNSEASRCWVDCEKLVKERARRNMSLQEAEELKDRCFASFKAKAVEFARRNDLSKFVKWFPQLAPEDPQAVSLLERQKEEFAELQASFAAMSIKKKKVTAEVKSESKSESSGESSGESKTESSGESNSKKKNARWVKYQKK
jgi:ubiquitin-protein ligase